jgi:hypothetical protein
VCTCAELILPLNLLGRKKKRGLSFILSTEAKRKRERKGENTYTHRERKSRNGGKCNESKQNYSLLPAG